MKRHYSLAGNIAFCGIETVRQINDITKVTCLNCLIKDLKLTQSILNDCNIHLDRVEKTIHKVKLGGK